MAETNEELALRIKELQYKRDEIDEEIERFKSLILKNCPVSLGDKVEITEHGGKREAIISSISARSDGKYKILFNKIKKDGTASSVRDHVYLWSDEDKIVRISDGLDISSIR